MQDSDIAEGHRRHHGGSAALHPPTPPARHRQADVRLHRDNMAGARLYCHRGRYCQHCSCPRESRVYRRQAELIRHRQDLSRTFWPANADTDRTLEAMRRYEVILRSMATLDSTSAHPT
ncbi:uncharacterized protein EAF01_010859 [Botrytis porri]|uniref:uncharacterized protein n=1 Tax=Botrytis porri TaxID=87229 RepID=UPI0019013C01|nr:uncharacterized protein EAF01_010859 [Botrytis porri]KAF7889366.1 hypothetical protein EAF01_010859 [Botrytis porri]